MSVRARACARACACVRACASVCHKLIDIINK